MVPLASTPFVSQQWPLHDAFSAPVRPRDDNFRRFYGGSLQRIEASVRDLVPHLLGRVEETKWMEHLRDYLQRLLRIEPASTPEEQFNLLYTFRKWILWVPPLLLKANGRDPKTLLVITYFYATALRLEPLFPEVGNEFIAVPVLSTLSTTLQYLGVFEQQPTFQYQAFHELSHLLSYPQEALTSYHVAHSAPPTPESMFSGPFSGINDVFSSVDMSFAPFGQQSEQSPAMIPTFRTRSSVDSASIHSNDWSLTPGSHQGSPFLGLPNLPSDGQFYGRPLTNPAMQHHRGSLDETYEMMRRSVDFNHSGFVEFTPEIWT